MSRTQIRSAAATVALVLLAILVVQAAPRTPNQAPAASIAAPTAGASFATGSNIAITATASDVDGSIARVDFYVDGVRIGRDPSAPYGINWSNASVGTHALKAVATDHRKATGSSATGSVSVGPGSPPHPPTPAPGQATT